MSGKKVCSTTTARCTPFSRFQRARTAPSSYIYILHLDTRSNHRAHDCDLIIYSPNISIKRNGFAALLNVAGLPSCCYIPTRAAFLHTNSAELHTHIYRVRGCGRTATYVTTRVVCVYLIPPCMPQNLAVCFYMECDVVVQKKTNSHLNKRVHTLNGARLKHPYN